MVRVLSKKKDMPDNFGSDKLSDFLDTAQGNVYGMFAGNKSYKYLAAVDQCFAKICENLAETKDPFPAFLLLRCHSSYRAVCMTIMAGQAVESFVLLRSLLEFAGYALIMKDDKKSIVTWMERHDGSNDKEKEKSKDAVGRRFGIKRVRELIKSKDKKLGEIFDLLYNSAVDRGGHPNTDSVLGSFTVQDKTVESNKRVYQQAFLHDVNSPFYKVALKSVIESGLCALYIFDHIFPERFQILGIKNEMAKLRNVKSFV